MLIAIYYKQNQENRTRGMAQAPASTSVPPKTYILNLQNIRMRSGEKTVDHLPHLILFSTPLAPRFLVHCSHPLPKVLPHRLKIQK
jgi:hypothetical protein